MTTARPVALVTGARSGIGLACADKLAEAGFAVYGTSRRPGRSRISGTVQMLALDVQSDASVKRCVDRVLADEARIDVLVNNAGVAIIGAVEETSLDEIRSVIETNFFGALRMIRAVLPSMRARRSGRIINIGSTAGFLPLPYSAAYCASKHALRGLSESLDHEVRRFGIRVSLIEPGYIRTDIVENSPEARAAFEPYRSARSGPVRAFRREIARGADAGVVARTVVKAATECSPSLRYLPDANACLAALARAALPSPVFDCLFRLQARLDEDFRGAA